MDRTRILKLTLLAGAAVTLQGCVAAIAPIAAASGVFGSTATRGSGADVAAAAPTPTPAPAPVSDPTVIVESSEQSNADEEAFVARISEPVPEPGQNAIASAEIDAPADRAAIAEPDENSAMATVADAEPVAVGQVQQTAAFDSAFAESTPEQQLEPESAATEIALASSAATAPEPESGRVAIDQRPAGEAPLRIIAVDPRVALADNSSTTASVSAAQAAAALTALPANAEPDPAPVGLARTPRLIEREADVAPSATTIAVAEMAPDPAAVETPTMSAASSVAVTPSPAPLPEPEADRPAPRPLATGDFASLINYAGRQQARSADERRAAVLADRASLMPTRAACGGTDPTVLIDLDPQGGTFDPTNVRLPTPGLSSALAQLRAMGVRIAWISSNQRDQIGAIREALNRSGLDLDNSDELLLMRYPEDRKQTRREDLAASSCLIAIAGDKRSDFDELFEYLINPEAAASLDPLIENGWFIIPQPLITERP